MSLAPSSDDPKTMPRATGPSGADLKAGLIVFFVALPL